MEKPIDKVITRFKAHYPNAVAYTDAQVKELRELYRWMRPNFAAHLYDEVIKIHRTKYRVMPDVSAIEKAILGMNAPAVYDSPTEQLALPEPGAVDRSAEVKHITEVLTGRREPDAGDQEINHVERQRIRVKVARGNATDEERFWISCIDDYGGDWAAAYKAKEQSA